MVASRGACVDAAASVDYAGLSFRELQLACKEAGLKAMGKVTQATHCPSKSCVASILADAFNSVHCASQKVELVASLEKWQQKACRS